MAIFGHLHGPKNYFYYFIEPMILFLPEYETVEVLVVLVDVLVEVLVEVLADLVTG